MSPARSRACAQFIADRGEDGNGGRDVRLSVGSDPLDNERDEGVFGELRHAPGSPESPCLLDSCPSTRPLPESQLRALLDGLRATCGRKQASAGIGTPKTSSGWRLRWRSPFSPWHRHAPLPRPTLRALARSDLLLILQPRQDQTPSSQPPSVSRITGTPPRDYTLYLSVCREYAPGHPAVLDEKDHGRAIPRLLRKKRNVNPIIASGLVFMYPRHCVGTGFILLLHNVSNR